MPQQLYRVQQNLFSSPLKSQGTYPALASTLIVYNLARCALTSLECRRPPQRLSHQPWSNQLGNTICASNIHPNLCPNRTSKAFFARHLPTPHSKVTPQLSNDLITKTHRTTCVVTAFFCFGGGWNCFGRGLDFGVKASSNSKIGSSSNSRAVGTHSAMPCAFQLSNS